MQSTAACVQENTSVENLLAFFLENGLRAAPVLRADSTLAGYVSLADLVLDRDRQSDTQELALDSTVRDGAGVELGPGFHLLPQGRTVADVMTFPGVHRHASAPLTMGAAVTAFAGLGRLPIVDGGGRAVGMLAGIDVLRWLAQQRGYCIPDCAQRMRGDARYRH